MAMLYDTIHALCEERGISGYKLCADIGVSKSILTDLKMGRKKTINVKTANKIANYFGVSVGYLLGEESAQKKEALPDLTEEDRQDIAKRLEGTLEDLMLRQEGLMFDGEPLDDITRELLETSLRNSMILAKRMAKARDAEKKKHKEK